MVNRRIESLSASERFSFTAKATHTIAQQVGQPEWRAARVLSSQSFGRRRVTFDVRQQEIHIFTPRTLLTVFLVPTVVVTAIGLAYSLGLPARFVWPIALGVIVGTIALLAFLRARNLVLYLITTAGAGCLARGGLGLTLRTGGQTEGVPSDGINAWWDVSYGASEIVDVVLILTGLVLFTLATKIQLAREFHTDAPSDPSTSPSTTDDSRSSKPVSDDRIKSQIPLFGRLNMPDK